MSYLVVMTSYRVREKRRDEYLELIEAVKKNAISLGAVNFYLLEDDVSSNNFMEVMVYDGWLPYDRAGKKPLSREMEKVFETLDACLDGGSGQSTTTYFRSRIGSFEPAPEAPVL